MRTLIRMYVATAIAIGLLSCGGNKEESAQTAETKADDPIAAKTEAIQNAPNLSQEAKDVLTKWANYQTVNDPDAVYTMADLPDWGNYRKLNLTKLSDAQLNRVIHKLKTVTCDCPGCGEGWPLDRCLVVRPECYRGVTMAQEVIATERVLGDQ